MAMLFSNRVSFIYLVFSLFSNDWATIEAFSNNHAISRLGSHHLTLTKRRTGTSTRSLAPLYFFGRKKNQGESSNKEEKVDQTDEIDSVKSQKRTIPFFGNLLRENKTESVPEKMANEIQDQKSDDIQIQKPNDVIESTVSNVESVEKKKEEVLKPVDQVSALKAQAERARLEAEKMDAELNLYKIEKLEKQLTNAKKRGDSIDDLQRQMDQLQAKMRGEVSKPVQKQQPLKKEVESRFDLENPASPEWVNKVQALKDFWGESPKSRNGEFEDVVGAINLTPGFFKRLLAVMVEYDFDTVANINATELALRISMTANGDFSYSTKPKPFFTSDDIDRQKELLRKNPIPWLESSVSPDQARNETALAIKALEYRYYVKDPEEDLEKVAMETAEGITNVLGANKSEEDRMIESMFPKATRKEGQEPTMAQVQMLVSSVLPKAQFSTSSKPEKVLGGYLIRGSHRYDTGDELIDSIDREMRRTSLDDKMTVVYVFSSDFQFDEQQILDPEPVLYVLGPDIVREPKPVALTVCSALGLATAWYLSIFPFLLNPAINKRVEEQLSLADSNMAYDLNWLVDLSLPLFVTFLGIQFSHEIAHTITAAAYNMTTSVPTFVPSLVTGMTGTVTTFKSPPKNKQQMFDFSISGPITGLLASIAALTVGTGLTLLGDPATLPALPLEFLRQSTLGGAIINAILGDGALNLPAGAAGTSVAASLMIPLHPVAIAGFMGLLVNALSLLPLGTTDGGRICQTVFGRNPKQVIGICVSLTMLIVGLNGSDLFLFYVSFFLAFQAGCEIPAKNEVDSVSFSRVMIAMVSVIAAVLVLVPYQ